MTSLLFTTAASGALRAPEIKIEIRSAGKLTQIDLSAPAKHHFNLKAPMSLQVGKNSAKLKPVSAKEHFIRFEIPQTREDLSLSVFICDDLNSFCEKHAIHASWNGTSSYAAAYSGQDETKRMEHPLERSSAHDKNGRDAHGFLVNQPEKALALAKEEKRPLLIDFFGIWCPPCNELDEKVFSTPSFARETKDFVKLKLDADAEVSWELKSKFKVGGYPTIVFASATGDEINRIVGFRPVQEFNAEVKKAWELRDSPLLTRSVPTAAGDPETLRRIGLMHFNRREYSEAEKYLGTLKQKPEEYFDAKIGLIDDAAKTRKNATEPELREALISSLKAFPDSPGSLLRRARLAELTPEKAEKEKIFSESVRVGKTLVHSPGRLAGQDFSIADIWSILAEAQESLGQADDAKRSWTSAAREYEKVISSPHERGYNLERAYCLWKAGDISGAESLYRSLEDLYPKEFTFYFAHASMLRQLGKLPEAKTLAEKSFEFSYGDNRLRAAHLLAQLLTAEGKKEEARSLVAKVLKDARLPSDPMIRTHRYAKQLEDLISSK